METIEQKFARRIALSIVGSLDSSIPHDRRYLIRLVAMCMQSDAHFLALVQGYKDNLDKCDNAGWRTADSQDWLEK